MRAKHRGETFRRVPIETVDRTASSPYIIRELITRQIIPLIIYVRRADRTVDSETTNKIMNNLNLNYFHSSAIITGDLLPTRALDENSGTANTMGPYNRD